MGQRMRVVFAGTPAFAAASLSALWQAGFEVPLVLTQPDRPAGRGMKLQASEVKRLALAQGTPVLQPQGLRLGGAYAAEAAAAREALLELRPDVIVVAAYGLILPDWVLGLPRLGCINVHASLLPRWRGAAPIHRAIEAGDTETGITIMQMDAGLDTGDQLLCERMPIATDDTTARLHDKLAALGGRLLVEALELAACGGLTPVPQPTEGVTYAHKIDKAESLIDWALSADTLARRVRAFDPYPGMATRLGDGMLKVWAARALPGPTPGVPVGTVLELGKEGVQVATGDGVLLLTELQRAGGKRLSATDFLAGAGVQPGQRLGVCAPVP
jgi:methionyl-tRNA formyltransferase